GNGPGAMACLKPLAGLLLLVRRQLRLAAELDALGSGNPSTVVGPLDDPLALILGHGAEEVDEAAAHGGGKIQMRLAQHLDQGAALVDAVDDADAIEHAAGGTVPLGNDQHVAFAELVDRSLELRSAHERFAGGLLAEDFMAPLGAQGADLSVE